MENWKQKLAEIMEITDPNKALAEMALLVHREKLPLTVLEESVEAYTAKYGVDEDEMSLYPDGRRVITEELFQ